jgi:hypothetical protein
LGYSDIGLANHCLVGPFPGGGQAELDNWMGVLPSRSGRESDLPLTASAAILRRQAPCHGIDGKAENISLVKNYKWRDNNPVQTMFKRN